MAVGTYLNFPFDEDVFLYQWRMLKNPEKEAILSSGAMVKDDTIKKLIANGSDIYSAPFYNLLDTSMAPDNYDGATDIKTSSLTGTSMTGVVFGRTHGFTTRDFIKDFNSGADPMKVIVANVAKYWDAWDEIYMMGILNAILGVTGNDEWDTHTLNLATVAGSVNPENTMGISTMGDFAQQSLGDNRDAYTLAIMHSKVARDLENQELLKFRVNTDPNGIQRKIRIADYNGMTTLVTDRVPVKNSESASGAKEYTTLVLGGGILRQAYAPVDHPVSVSRNESKNGGEEYLWTRNRMSIYPYGFSFKKPKESYTSSPTLAQLSDKNNWELVEKPKVLPIGQIITNG